MTMYCKVDGRFVGVPSGAMKFVVDEILEGKMDIEKAKKYLSEQELGEKHHTEWGYIDFDQLTKDGKPTVVGNFYKNNTTVGLKLTGEWKKTLEKIAK